MEIVAFFPVMLNLSESSIPHGTYCTYSALSKGECKWTTQLVGTQNSFMSHGDIDTSILDNFVKGLGY